jgi:iron complex outermembrane receptor protein
MKMKRLALLLTVCLAFFGCNQKPVDGAQLLKILNDENLSLVVSNNDSISRHASPRVDDLMRIVTTEPERLKGAVVADKKVGNAAASLLALGGVSEVHTNYTTPSAKRILAQAGVKLVYASEGDFIFNNDSTGQCPMDSTLNGIADHNEGFARLKEKFYNK